MVDLNTLELKKLLGSGDANVPYLISLLSPPSNRFVITATYQKMDELAGWKVDSIGSARYFGSEVTSDVLWEDSDLRLAAVGIALPCEGGWLLAGNPETIFVLMDKEDTKAKAIKVSVDDGSYSYVDVEVDLEAIIYGSDYVIASASGYVADAQELVQEHFDANDKSLPKEKPRS